MKFRGDREAFGGPGIEPRWTQGNKEGVGTSPFPESKLWFTLWRGVVTEVYYPLIDHPQIRDLQFLVSDGRTFFHEEKRHLDSETEALDPHALAYRVRSSDPTERYRLEKEVLSDPHLPVLLQQTRLVPAPRAPRELSLYALLAPHLDCAGYGNNGYVVELAGRQLLVAERNGTWLALGATRPFRQLSCGYVGASDGWTDLSENYLLDYEFDRATNGNVALTGQIDLEPGAPFTLGLAFGRGLSDAVAALLQSLSVPFEVHRQRFLEGWRQVGLPRPGPSHRSGDGGRLYRMSHALLVAHEDKTFRGARIASLSIPWGQARGDDDRGGYHLVWTRDLVQTAIGLLAAGRPERALPSLIYLASSQRPDGGFPQNNWLSGEAYWPGIQLDEVAFPILLAGLLDRERALEEFDPWPMVRAASGFLLAHGPATQQERWEELAGYSPSTIAAGVAALVVAAGFARRRSDPASAAYLEAYADYLSHHLEGWTVTQQGTLDPKIPRHFVRIRPADPADSWVSGPPDLAPVRIANLPADVPSTFPAREIVDAGFLELVRYGVRPPDDPLIARSVEVIDPVLGVSTLSGPVWRRYNHDGYGQRDDGGPFVDVGRGRAWPLLTGERAHYELARGGDVAPLVRALEGFSSPTGLLPEQVWDTDDRPDLHLVRGRPTTSAMPLAWAHAEYLKLLRSIDDGRIFDRVAAVAERYGPGAPARPRYEIWKPHHRPQRVVAGATVRVQAEEPFRLHVSRDAWATSEDLSSDPNPLGLHSVDLPTADLGGRSYVFTFYWTERSTWEGRDYSVAIDPVGSGPAPAARG